MKNKPKPSEPLYSVTALAKLLGVDRKTIDKTIVRCGIKPKGFVRGSPVYPLGPIEIGLRSKPDKTLREEKLIEEVRKLRISNAKELGQLLDESAETAWLYGLASGAAGILWQKLVNEAPPATAKLDEPSARIYFKRLYNAVMGKFRELIKSPEMREKLHTFELKLTE